VSELASDHLWGFLSSLRTAGLPSSPDKQRDFLRAVAEAPPRDPTGLYWTARITLLQSITGLADFDRVFDDWFRRDRGVEVLPPPGEQESEVEAPRGGGDEELPEQDARAGDGLRASAVDTRSRREFGGCELQRELLAALESAWSRSLPGTPSRRYRRARSGPRLDMGRVWRAAQRHDGEIVELPRRSRPPRPRRLLVLIDVSASVQQHSPDLLRVAHAALRAAPARTEVFTFGTRLTRVTAALAGPRLDRALTAVSAAVPDAAGGTAIGAALQQFLGNPRGLALARGALIVVASDGLERGDPAPMVAAAARLSRLGHRFLWWSPLACSPTYRPVTRAMAAQLGHLDHLGGVHDMASALTEVRRIPAVLAGPRRAAARRWADPIGGRP
jgi:uncharacterized protein with von Willebrand factor type A (vWA) domain